MPKKQASATKRPTAGGRPDTWMPTRCPLARWWCVNPPWPRLPLGASPSMRGSPLLTRKATRDRQMQRLRDYAAAKGYAVAKEVSEIASGLNDHRPKLSKLLTDPTIGTLIVEHRDRLTRFGYEYIRQLLETQGRHLEVLFPSETEQELVDDFVAVITSMAARIYGQRSSRQKAAKIRACVERVMQEGDA